MGSRVGLSSWADPGMVVGRGMVVIRVVMVVGGGSRVGSRVGSLLWDDPGMW